MERKALLKFEHDGKKYAILTPTQENLLQMDMQFRQAFSTAVREGLMTEFEAKRVFEKNGTWTDEHDKELSQLQMDIVQLELELEKIEAGKDGREIAFKVMDKRNKLLEMINYKSRLFSAQTVEGYAESIKIATLAYLCSVDQKGKLVFPTKEAFCASSDTELTAICYAKAMMANAGLNEEDLKIKFSEREWLNDQGYVDKEGSFTKKYYDELVDEALPKKKAEEKIEDKPVEKKTRKKRKVRRKKVRKETIEE